MISLPAISMTKIQEVGRLRSVPLQGVQPGDFKSYSNQQQYFTVQEDKLNSYYLITRAFTSSIQEKFLSQVDEKPSNLFRQLL